MNDLKVLYEDNHLILINKKAGQIIQEDKTGDTSLDSIVADYIARKYKKPGKAFVGVVHRLDRPASGIVLFARTSKALVRLNEMFQNKEIKKTYWVVVRNKMPDVKGKLVNHLKRLEKRNITLVYEHPVTNSKIAELEYEVIAEKNGYQLLQINLITGRHHQIRAQLANCDCPVVGDNKYGYPRSNRDRSICLHAREISFTHPVSKTLVHCIAELPDDPVWNLFK